MSSKQRFIKVKYLDDFLKFENKDSNFDDFKRRVKLAVPEIVSEIIFHYLDQDGDKISVRNQETFEIFLEECESMKLDLTVIEPKSKPENRIKNEVPIEKNDTTSDDMPSIKQVKKEINAPPPYKHFAKTDSKISLASILSDFTVKNAKKPKKNGWPIKKPKKNIKKERKSPPKETRWSVFDNSESLDKDLESDEALNKEDSIELPVKRSFEDSIQLPVKRNSEDSIELPVKRKIEDIQETQELFDIENYDPAQDKDSPPIKKQKINYQSIDGEINRKDVLPLAKKIEIKNLAINPLLDPINDFFILPGQPDNILCGEPTPFFIIISQIIKTCAKNYGLRKTSIFFNLESDFCLFLFKDPQEFDASKIDNFYEYYSSDARGENYQFPKINPKVCYKNICDLKVQPSMTREQALSCFGTSNANLNTWIEIFDEPLNKAPLNDSYPNLFRFKIVSDYLDGKFSIEDLEQLFNVTKKHIQRWAHFFSDEKNVPKGLLEKEEKKIKKVGYVPKPKKERVLDLKELMSRGGINGPKITKKSKERITDQIVAAYNLISSQQL